MRRSSMVLGAALSVLTVATAYLAWGLQAALACLGFIIGGLQLAGARWITEEESTHPAYKVEKIVWGAVYIGSALITVLSVEWVRTLFRSFTSILLVGSTVLAFLFIYYRRENPLYHVIKLRTARGVIISGDIKENNQALSKAAALIRHHRAGGGQPLVSDWAIAEVDHAMRVREVDHWVQDVRNQAKERKGGLSG